MERKIFNSYESRLKSRFDDFTLRAWWLRSTETYPPGIANTEYSQFYTGYIGVTSYICYNNPHYYYYITPICSI